MVLSSQRFVSTANPPRGWLAGGPAPEAAYRRQVGVVQTRRMAISWWRNACVIRMMLWGLCVAPFAAAASAAVSDSADEARWAAHGFSAAQRSQLREVWQWGIENRFVPGGAMLVVHRGEVIFREAFGVADLETKPPFPVDAPCRLASVTKPYTATLLAMLVEQGKVGWDDPVNKFLPQMAKLTVREKGPAARPPKIRELLSHTAGFPGNSERRSGATRVRTGGTLVEAVDEIARAGLVTEPGTAYAYTGFGYMVAGRVAEVVTGREFAALMREKLLAPLGAIGVVFLPSASAALKARMPTRYERIDGTLQRADEAGADEAGVGFPNPGGGLVATVDEVAKFLLLHRNHGLVDGVRLVAPESLQALYRPQPMTGREGYGFGFNVLRTDASGIGDRMRHNGASGTSVLIDFKADLLVVVLTQVPTKQRLPFGNRLNQVIDTVFPSP
jgi:CubicO group peptidase (beta-lactamase class C family)